MVIFSNRHKVEGQDFTFGTEKITIADSYTYLGITFTKNGNLKEAVTALCDKAMKDMFSLCTTVHWYYNITNIASQSL